MPTQLAHQPVLPVLALLLATLVARVHTKWPITAATTRQAIETPQTRCRGQHAAPPMARLIWKVVWTGQHMLGPMTSGQVPAHLETRHSCFSGWVAFRCLEGSSSAPGSPALLA